MTSRSFSNLALPKRTWKSVAGSLLYYLFPVKKTVMEANIHNVFGDSLTKEQVSHLIKVWYGHLLMIPFELLLNQVLPFFVRKRMTTVQGLEKLDNALKEGRGALWLTCHMGNWEVGIFNFLTHAPHLMNKITTIRKKLKPEWMHHFVMKRSERSGINILPREPATIKKVLRKLGNNEIVVFVIDQHASKEESTTTSFMGHPVQMTKSLARIAIKTGSPVIPVASWRSGWGRHTCYLGDPIEAVKLDDKDASIQATTQKYADEVERLVLERPDQWFSWAHHLWKAAGFYKKRKEGRRSFRE